MTPEQEEALHRQIEAIAGPLLQDYDVEHCLQLSEIVREGLPEQEEAIRLYQAGFKVAILFVLMGRISGIRAELAPPSEN